MVYNFERKQGMNTFCLVIAFCLILSCDKESGNDISPGVNSVSISFGGLNRTFLVQLPAEAGDVPAPVVFAFHGGQGTNSIYPDALENLINDRHWIGVYPQGVNGFWNSDIGTSTANDTGLVREIVRWLDERTSIDHQRIYALGFSNGAILCHKMARESDVFAAIAPVNGSWLVGQTITDAAPEISVFHVSSVNDEIVPYNGGAPQGLNFQSVATMMNGYAAHNGCVTTPQTLDSTTSITHFQFSSCSHGEVMLYRLNNKTHFLDDPTWTSLYPLIFNFFDGKSK